MFRMYSLLTDDNNNTNILNRNRTKMCGYSIIVIYILILYYAFIVFYEQI